MSADVSARLAWPDDARAIAKIQRAVWRDDHDTHRGHTMLEGIDEETQLASWQRTIAAPPDTRVRVLVALEGPTVRGYALLHPSADDDADPVSEVEVGELAIDPLHRRAGHGSRLLQACVDTAEADRATELVWWLGTEDDHLRSWVTSSGWQADGAHREFEGPGEARLRQVRVRTRIGPDE